MIESEIKVHARKLADVFDGTVRSSKRFFLAERFCPYEISGEVYGVRLKIWFGRDGGLAMFDRYCARESFQLSFFAPDLTLGLTSEITSLVGAPVRTFSNSAELYVAAIKEMFPTWESWLKSIEPLRQLDAPVTVTSEQSQWAFTAANVPRLDDLIKWFARRLSTAPFDVIRRRIASRYSDKPTVKLDPSKVPSTIRHLLPLAARWSIADESEMRKFAASASLRSRTAFLSSFQASMPEIESFCGLNRTVETVADEVVAFQLASRAFAILSSQGAPKRGS